MVLLIGGAGVVIVIEVMVVVGAVERVGTNSILLCPAPRISVWIWYFNHNPIDGTVGNMTA